MNKLYTLYDYEEAYCQRKYYDCKKIGLYLLSFDHCSKNIELSKKLSKLNYSWDMTEEEKKEMDNILQEVKIWVMINYF